VINNIPTMIQRFGGPAGLAAAISLVAVGINILLPKLKELYGAMKPEGPREYADAFKALEERIKKLEDVKVNVAIDTFELDLAKRKLDALKKDQAEYDAQQKHQTFAQAASGKAIQAKVDEAGAHEIIKDLKGQLIPELLANSQTIQQAKAARAQDEKDIEQAKKDAVSAPTADERLAAMGQVKILESEITKAEERACNARHEVEKPGGEAETRAGELLRRSREGNGPDQVAAQADLAARLRRSGRNTLAQDVAANSPARSAKYAQAEQDFKDQQKEVETEKKAAAKLADDEKKAEDARIDELNKQGKDNEAAALAERRADEKATKVDKAGAKVQAGLDKAGVKRQVAEEDASIKAGGHVDLAEDLMARVRDQGGAVNPRTGQFHRMNQDQQFEFVRSQVAEHLHGRIGTDRAGRAIHANAGMSKDLTWDLSTRIAVEARQNYTKRLADLSSRGMVAQEATQQAVADTQQNVTMLMNRLARIEANNGRLTSNARDQNRHLREHQAPNQNWGGP
jgi:hypothetical protein